jgi:hypothetical protein
MTHPWIKTPFVLLFAGILVSLLGCDSPVAGGYSMSGTVFDKANGMPVHGARVRFGGRSTILYTARDFSFTRIPRKEGMLVVEAPGYAPFRRPLTLKGRDTPVDVALEGREVPGLAGILVWAQWEADDLRIDTRLLDSSGTTLENFPCLAFRAEARLAVNLGTETAPRAGEILFEGPTSVTYDPAGGLDKLKSRIPRDAVRAAPAGRASGMLTFVLITDQGRFVWQRGDVALRGGKK